MAIKGNQTSGTISPGRGERWSIGGLVPQYLAAVNFVLQQLKEKTLEEVRLAELEAGRADDLLILAKPQRLIAYQMKKEGGEISYADFANSQTGSGIIRDMAQSWLRLRSSFPERNVSIRFLTTQALSAATHKNVFLPVDDTATERSFARFLNEAWSPFRHSLAENATPYIAPGWKPAIDHWQQASGLTNTQFIEFSKALELAFDFDFPWLEQLREYASDKDVKTLYLAFQEAVAQAKQSDAPVGFTKEDLEELLGKARFSQRNIHFFKLPNWFEPIASSGVRLNAAVENLDRGYLALLGTPGSGKSSLLTQVLVTSARTERIVRYYAYINENEPYGTPPRGEAVNFLHDVVFQLEQYGFYTRRGLPELDLDSLRTRLGQQLELLAKDYQEHGQKTIIIVDGLDHIAREQTGRIDKSLLHELPSPQQLPKGVLIVLGSQHLHDLPVAIVSHLNNEQRILEIDELTLDETLVILKKSGVWQHLVEETTRGLHNEGKRLQEIYHLTQGHPLALAYLVNQLNDAIRRQEPIWTVVGSVVAYRGDIHQQYEAHWRQVDAELHANLRHLVGLVSRIRANIDFRWIRSQWQEYGTAIGVLENRFRHFFREVSPGEWQFFHNSFRQFLLSQSVATIDGPDPEIERRLHYELATKCQNAAGFQAVQWEALYHLWKAQELERVCNIATRDFFEEQLLGLRPRVEIIQDARLAVSAAARLQDPLRLIRALFILAENANRDSELDEFDETMLRLLIGMERGQTAISWILEGRKLRGLRFASDTERMQASALHLVVDFFKAGYRHEAKQLFDIAEPLHLLRSGQSLSTNRRDEEWNALVAWVKVAPLFYKVPKLIEQIRLLTWIAEDGLTGTKPNPSRSHQNALLVELGKALIENGLLTEVRLVLNDFHITQGLEELWYWYQVQVHLCWVSYQQNQLEELRPIVLEMEQVLNRSQLHAEISRCRQLIEDLRREKPDSSDPRYTSFDFGLLTRIQNRLQIVAEICVEMGIAQYLICGDREQAARWVEIVTQADMLIEGSVNKTAIATTQVSSDWYALLMALETAVPTSAGDQHRSRTPMEEEAERIYANLELKVINLRAQRWKGETVSSVDLSTLISAVLSLHQRPQPRFLSAHLILKDLVDEVLRHDHGLQVLKHKFQQAWTETENQQYWPLPLRREVLLMLHAQVPGDRWVYQALTEIVDVESHREDLYSNIKEALEQASLAIQLGAQDKAIGWIEKAVYWSLGIRNEKDYQLVTWIDWLDRRNQLEPERVADRIELYANRIVGLNPVTSGVAPQAAARLLQATRRWNHASAVDLFWWYFEHHCLWYYEEVQAFLDWYITLAEGDVQVSLAPIVAALNSLALPWWKDSGSQQLFVRLLELIARQGQTLLGAYGSRIAQIVKTQVPLEERRGLLEALYDVLRQNGVSAIVDGTEIDSLPEEREQQGSLKVQPLSLSDGRHLSQEEVIRLVLDNCQTLKELRALEQTSEESYRNFSWDELIVRLAPRISTIDDLSTIAESAHDITSDSYRITLALATRAHQLGHYELAQLLAEKTLAHATSQGWLVEWGGAKIKSYHLLVELDPIKYRERAFDGLAQDFERDELSAGRASQLVQALDLLFTIFCEPQLELQVCELVEEHVTEILRSIPIPIEELGFLHSSLDRSESASATILYLLTSHFLLPIPDIRLRVLRALTEACLEEPNVVKQLFKTLEESRETEVIRYLTALARTLASIQPKLVRPYLYVIQRLLQSEFFEIVEAAREILQRLGEPVPRLEPLLVLPTSTIEADVILVPGEKDIDPFAQTTLGTTAKGRLAPFWEQAYALAYVTKTDPDVIFRWGERLLNRRGDTAQVLDEAETALRRRIEVLRLPYRRPRSISALSVIHEMATGLRRNGRLSDDTARDLYYRFLNHFDLDLVLWYAQVKPPGIAQIEIGSGLKREEWAARLSSIDGLEVCPRYDENGWYILAESIWSQSNEHNSWEERHVTTLVPQEADWKTTALAASSFHLQADGTLVSRYPNQHMPSDPDAWMHLTFRPRDHWLETYGQGWISIRPDLAWHLGWRPLPSFALSWETKLGELVVRSFGWQNGTPNRHIYNSDEQGWRVIVSPTAWDALRMAIPGSPARIIEIQRGFQGYHEAEAVQRWID